MDLTPDSVTWLYRSLLGRNPHSVDMISGFIQKHQTFENARQDILNSSEFIVNSKRLKQRHGANKRMSSEQKFQALSSLWYGDVKPADLQGDFANTAFPALDVFASFHGPARERVVLCLGGVALRESLIAALSSSFSGNCLLIDKPFYASSWPENEAADGEPASFLFPRPGKYVGPKNTVFYLPLPGSKEFLWEVMAAATLEADITVCMSDDISNRNQFDKIYNVTEPKNGSIVFLGENALPDDVTRRIIKLKRHYETDFLPIPGGRLLNIFDFQTKIVIPKDTGTAEIPFVKNGPSLAFAAIVKNEEPRIADMLNSIFPLVSFVALLDTGSTDNTIAVAKALCEQANIPYSIQEAPFTTFDDVRNKAIRLVPQEVEWILMLDADEILVARDYAKIAELMSQDVEAWSLPRYNIFDVERQKQPRPYPDRQTRLFRNLPHLFWRGNVHETLRGAKSIGFAAPNTVVLDGNEGGPHIHHLGPISRKRTDQAQKRELYDSLGALLRPAAGS